MMPTGAGKRTDEEREMKTLNYYETNAEAYYDKTVDVDFGKNRSIFLSYLKEGAHLLDFGCGSGRDAKAFHDAGYKAEALDGCARLCELASDHMGLNVRKMDFTDFHEKEKYDGIWACASLLHLPCEALKQVLFSLYCALKPDGILYASFKYGTFEGMREERYYTDFDEEKMARLLSEVNVFELEKEWITQDVIPGREAQKWMNILLRRAE